MSISVLLVDDHQIIREGLKGLINSQPDMEVVADVDSGEAAIKAAMEYPVDVIVMDVSMPTLNGIEATRRILKQNKRIKIMGLSMHADRQYVAGMLAAGASAYLTKDCAFEELAVAVRAVLGDHIYVSPKIAPDTIEAYVRLIAEPHSLTDREIEVLHGLCEGKTAEQIGTARKIRPVTVEKHLGSIMTKFGTDSLVKLTKLAIREGFTSIEV